MVNNRQISARFAGKESGRVAYKPTAVTVMSPFFTPPANRPSAPSFKRIMVRPPEEPVVPEASPDESGYRRVSDALAEAFGDQSVGFLDEIGDEQLNMMVSLVCIERMLDKLPHDPSAHAAAESIRARIADIARLRDALDAVYAVSGSPTYAALFTPDGHLADFMRGLYVWTGIVMRALERTCLELRDLQPDWARLRDKIEEGAHFYFRELIELVRAEVEALRITSPRDVAEIDVLDERLEDMFFAAGMLHAKLEDRFG